MAVDRRFKTKAEAKKYVKQIRSGRRPYGGYNYSIRKTKKFGWTVYRD